MALVTCSVVGPLLEKVFICAAATTGIIKPSHTVRCEYLIVWVLSAEDEINTSKRTSFNMHVWETNWKLFLTAGAA